MIRPISIKNQGSIIDLDQGNYRVFLLGGWKVRLNDFTMKAKNIDSNEFATIQRSWLPVQTFAYNKRAKRIFSMDVPSKGKYQINFQNPDSVKVKHSNLFFFNKFYPTQLSKDLEILITSKSGFQFFIK